MGVGSSTANKLDKALASDLPEDERYFGLENFGNTCYCNSVLQALYFCEPFRRAVLEYDKERSVLHGDPDLGRNPSRLANGGQAGVPADDQSENMLSALTDLFRQIASQKKRTGSVPPKSFVNRLRQENDLFSSYMHQDAHEFLNFILNDIADILQREKAEKDRRRAGLPPRMLKQARVFSNSNLASMNGGQEAPGPNDESANSPGTARRKKTFVHDLFEGELSSEVRCCCCETITQRTESFLDLSVDIEQHSSISSCLRNFSSTEMLRSEDKFYCDTCCTLQEAERRMRVKRLPRVLALHLKRFKFIEQLGRYKKLSYRVVFPLELRLCNTSDDAEDPDKLYSLFAVVVHVGSGPNHGHYVSLIKSHGHWLLFDDDCVEPKEEFELQGVFGVSQDVGGSTESGYLLFYSAAE